MADRRAAISDVLTLEQYRSLLRTAAKIEDRTESIAIFFYLSMMGRVGLRIGELIHMTSGWYKPDRSVVTVPPHEDCDCGYCRHLARNWASSREDLSFKEALEEYWKAKGESHGDVPIETDREKEIIQLYFEEVEYTRVSYATVLRRLKKVAELTDGVDADQIYGHMLRATCATHYMWAGARAPTVDTKFRWEDEKTKERYVEKTAFRAAQDIRRLRSNDPTDGFELRNNPPTYTDLRPEKETELITVDTWEPEGSVETHPRYRDDEEFIQQEIEDYSEADDDRVVMGPLLLIISTYWKWVDRISEKIYQWCVQCGFDPAHPYPNQPKKDAAFRGVVAILTLVYGGYTYRSMGLIQFSPLKLTVTSSELAGFLLTCLMIGYFIHIESGNANRESVTFEAS